MTHHILNGSCLCGEKKFPAARLQTQPFAAPPRSLSRRPLPNLKATKSCSPADFPFHRLRLKRLGSALPIRVAETNFPLAKRTATFVRNWIHVLETTPEIWEVSTIWKGCGSPIVRRCRTLRRRWESTPARNALSWTSLPTTSTCRNYEKLCLGVLTLHTAGPDVLFI
jgi:hypothetical protein